MMLIPLFSMAKGGGVSFGCAPDSLFKIDFSWDSSVIDEDYRNNRSTLVSLDKTIKYLNIENVDSVVIIAQASPEGAIKYNNSLARRRADALCRYISDKYPELVPSLKVRSTGESWAQLRSYVASDSVMSDAVKQRVLSILNNKSISVETRKWRLKRDASYDYLFSTYYPVLRSSTLFIIYDECGPVKPIALDTPLAPKMSAHKLPLPLLGVAASEPIKTSVRAAEVPSTKRDTLLFTLKSNMLYDALTVLNAELEVPISRHFSVAVEYLFPWWEHNNKYCLQLLELGVEGRYWFRNNVHKADRLTGHFLGLYGMSAMYDIQKEYNPAYQGEFWSAGLTYGYAMRIGKQKRVSLEFSLSMGYLSTDYRNYFPADDYSELYIDKLGYKHFNYFGPTKLKVSIGIPINICYNKKGGSR